MGRFLAQPSSVESNPCNIVRGISHAYLELQDGNGMFAGSGRVAFEAPRADRRAARGQTGGHLEFQSFWHDLVIYGILGPGTSGDCPAGDLWS